MHRHLPPTPAPHPNDLVRQSGSTHVATAVLGAPVVPSLLRHLGSLKSQAADRALLRQVQQPEFDAGTSRREHKFPI